MKIFLFQIKLINSKIKMSFFQNYNKYKNDKKNFSFLSYILILAFLIQYINSSENKSLDSSEFEMFNQSMNKYNDTKLYFDDITKKMKNINFNVILKIKYNELKRYYQNIETQIVEIQNELKGTNYQRVKVIKNINLLDDNMNVFEKKYNTTKKSYYEFEKVKDLIKHFLKIFFICLLVSIIIIMAIIAIVSYFVVKNQRRYYQLQEEYSVNTNEKELNKKTNDVNNINEKDIIQNDKNINSRNPKISIASSNSSSSNDEIKRK